MIKTTILSILVTLCYSICFDQYNAVTAQEIISHNKDALIFNIGIGQGLGMDVGDFTAVGFSKDGKFAWIKQHPQGESDFIYYRYYIQDLVTDNILWQAPYEYDPTLPDSTQAKGLDSLKVIFQDKLAAYGITKNSLKQLKPPVVTRFDTLDVIFTKEAVLSDLGEALGEITITVRSKLKGDKQVYHKKFGGELPWFVDIALSGYIRSPYEDRVALIIRKMDWGFEGIRYVNYDVVGVHLRAGWHE